MVTVDSSSKPATSTPPQIAPSTERVVLTGYMGAGKSTVGRALAAELGWEFVDLDHFLEARHSATIADLFTQHGEPAFRQFETRALAAALGRKNIVLALGGGAIESLANRLLIEQKPNTLTVFLDAPFGVLFDRCVLQPDAAIRPVLKDPNAAEARFKSRHPHYRRAAQLTVDTEPLTPAETVARLIEELRTR
ncbi:shikimate kinase [Terriglobus tenax]|uniref:shikimate kinase n=1 Tax=Terriglobus tenax TaxID=1111115 RepID=UPI0021DFA313|nr:shikimate kinase [Terriglobus tenax]